MYYFTKIFWLAFSRIKDNNEAMDAGQLIFVYSRLILGAVAAFLAIMLWSKTRDIAWMLIAIGAITAYIEIVCSTPEIVGFAAEHALIGFLPLAAMLLTVLRMVFFIGAFLIMIMRQYRH